jgi:hypothetical protein
MGGRLEATLPPLPALRPPAASRRRSCDPIANRAASPLGGPGVASDRTALEERGGEADTSDTTSEYCKSSPGLALSNTSAGALS